MQQVTHIEVSTKLIRDPFLEKFAQSLDVSIPAAMGHLIALWSWCVDFTDKGKIGFYEPETIAKAALWDGPAEDLIEALTEGAFIAGEGADMTLNPGIHVLS